LTTSEAVYASVSDQNAHVAIPPSECLNGCHAGTGPERAPVLTEPGHHLCSGKRSCTTRLDHWLRDLPDLYGLLLWVKGHGTVPGNPENARTKQPDAPAPMRLELDVRPGFGALAILHGWAEAIRDERKLPRRCTCTHQRPGHDKGRCTTAGCGCQTFTETQPTLAAECSLVLTNLAWCTQQDWAGDLYAEVKALHRTLTDTVGDYRARPVGRCAALLDRPGVPLPVLCGGALVMDRPEPDDEDQQTGVHCLTCGRRHEANEGLRELGLIVGALFGDNQSNEREAS
jgi:hypothetical protein